MKVALAGDTMLGRKVGERLAHVPPTELFSPGVVAAAREADFHEGLDALRGIGAPAGELAPSVERAAASTGAVVCSHLTDEAEYLGLVEGYLAQMPGSALVALREELPSVVRGSNIITCAADDVLVRSDGTSHTLYVILEGATTDGRGTGSTVGHSTSLGMPRPDGDVKIGPAGARVLGLSERSLRALPQPVKDLLANV